VGDDKVVVKVASWSEALACPVDQLTEVDIEPSPHAHTQHESGLELSIFGYLCLPLALPTHVQLINARQRSVSPQLVIWIIQVSCCIRILPLRPVTLHNLSIRISFHQVDADAPQRVNAPFGVARIDKVTRKELAEVCGERAIHDRVARLTHYPCLEGEIV
jgi:hypothetical protein